MLRTGSRKPRGQEMAKQSTRVISGQRWTVRAPGLPLPRSPDPKSTKAYVQGTLEVHIEKSVPVGQDYVITCSLDEDTGKLYKTRVSLYDGQGQHYASGRAVWVQVPRSLFSRGLKPPAKLPP